MKFKDYQTLSLFMVLGALTVIVLIALKVVLFAPSGLGLTGSSGESTAPYSEEAH